jgi:hypothetical protein
LPVGFFNVAPFEALQNIAVGRGRDKIVPLLGADFGIRRGLKIFVNNEKSPSCYFIMQGRVSSPYRQSVRNSVVL